MFIYKHVLRIKLSLKSTNSFPYYCEHLSYEFFPKIIILILVKLIFFLFNIFNVLHFDEKSQLWVDIRKSLLFDIQPINCSQEVNLAYKANLFSKRNCKRTYTIGTISHNNIKLIGLILAYLLLHKCLRLLITYYIPLIFQNKKYFKIPKE